MKKYYIPFIVCCLLFASKGLAQTMVLHDDRSKDSVESRTGPNLSRFVEMTIGVGFVVGADEKGARVSYGLPGEIIVCVRKKYKISAVYSMGFDLMWNLQYFKLKQQTEKRLPDSVLHPVERIDIAGYGISYYNRFNFDPGRGNYLGNYLDIGVAGNWIPVLSHLVKDSINTTQSNLPYVNKFSCDLMARLGRGHVALYVHYRLTDLFKSKYDYPELPRMMAGLEFGIY